MKRLEIYFASALMMAVPYGSALAGNIVEATVERDVANEVVLKWEATDPVDVFQIASHDEGLGDARLLSSMDGDGKHVVTLASNARPYFLLRDSRSGQTIRLAERVLQYEHSSNFRDLGGYAGANGKRVRWGRIYRSGGQATLTNRDKQYIRALGIASLVDLRSDEERVLAPTRLDGVPYHAVGYSMGVMFESRDKAKGDDPLTGLDRYASSYRGLPIQLTPHLKMIFSDLVLNKGPIIYNCSAGQDRTGFVTAIILGALGVSRETIYQDYLLSTPSRRVQWELPPISETMAQTSPAAALLASIQKMPEYQKANPLVTPDGTPFLKFALDEIDQKWGSPDAYLAHQVGISKVDIVRLRDLYLE
ncbi:tyrosine-protein phosphatase [Sphingobium bisphenolivorans]|uniref:tyrosine-protein phosphatase n=1 Tax=Sphingobium bisphenolivorans TaxID=1335760 RepID=UPI0003B56F0A|nr:tyrosine-protein phosphatase [Sphingobium bisphenolivorans]